MALDIGVLIWKEAIEEFLERKNRDKLAECIREYPYVLTMDDEIRDFVAGIIEGSIEPRKKRVERNREERLHRNAFMYEKMEFYRGLGIAKIRMDEGLNACALVCEECGLSDIKNIYKQIYVKKEYDTHIIIEARFKYWEGVAVLLANNKEKPQNKKDIECMVTFHKSLPEEEKKRLADEAMRVSRGVS